METNLLKTTLITKTRTLKAIKILIALFNKLTEKGIKVMLNQVEKNLIEAVLIYSNDTQSKEKIERTIVNSMNISTIQKIKIHQEN